MKKLFGLLLALTACVAETPDSLAPTLSVTQDNSYIVTLVRGADPEITARIVGATPRFIYRTALNGFAADLPAAAIEALRRNPAVISIEPDGLAHITQTNPPSWGLDRIDQRGLPLDNVYNYPNTGAGVRIYVLDTGIRFDHQEFQGRAVSGYDFVDLDPDASDCHGHGTHVAGTAGGFTVGVAKAATLVSVRVLNCSGSGSWSQVIAGVDWVAANHVKPAIANMSLAGGFHSTMNAAVNNAVAAGVTFAVGAANANQDACLWSPASAAAALTVGATTSTDARSSFSNWGTCLDLFAPGSNITSSTQTGTNTYEAWSGTSMATPHVAGVGALYAAANPEATPSQVAAAILEFSTSNVVSDPQGSPNRLLYNQFDGVQPPPPPPPPPAIVHIEALTGTARTFNKQMWRATVSVLVYDAAGNPAANITVTGSFGSCITASTGRCDQQSSNLKNTVSSATWTVNSLSGQWDSGADKAKSITIARP